MNHIFLLKGLTCPNCSAKIEKDVGEMNGVQRCSINLMRQTLTVDSDVPSDVLLRKITAIVHSHEPEVEVFEQDSAANDSGKKPESGILSDRKCRALMIRLVVGALLFGVAVAWAGFWNASLPFELTLLIVSYIVLGGDVVWTAAKNITRGRVFDEHFLMSVSTIGAFVIGEYGK